MAVAQLVAENIQNANAKVHILGVTEAVFNHAVVLINILVPERIKPVAVARPVAENIQLVLAPVDIFGMAQAAKNVDHYNV